MKTAAVDIAAQVARLADLPEERINRTDEEDEAAKQAKIAELRGQIAPIESKELDRILAEIDFKGWTVLVDPMESLLGKVYRDGEDVALLQIGVHDQDHLTDLLDERSLTYAQDRGAELVGMRNVGTKEAPEWIENPNAEWSITEATRGMIRGDVETAINEGWSAGHLESQLRDENPGFSAWRAETIARTEIRTADAAGNMTAYRLSGVVQGKEWLLGSEHDDDDACNENADAGVIGLDESFPTGDDTAPEHPNCVCDVIPVLMDEQPTNSSGEDEGE